MRSLLEKKDFYIRENKYVLLEDLSADGLLASDVKLIIDKTMYKNVELVVGKEIPKCRITKDNPDPCIRFKVIINPEDKKVAFHYADKLDFDRKTQNNIILFYYVKDVVNKVRNKIKDADYKDPKELKSFISSYR